MGFSYNCVLAIDHDSVFDEIHLSYINIICNENIYIYTSSILFKISGFGYFTFHSQIFSVFFSYEMLRVIIRNGLSDDVITLKMFTCLHKVVIK